jgi:4-nitrophenyl phosphatase
MPAMNATPPDSTPIAGLLLDLDGTEYHGERAVPGAPEFLRRLRREGVPFLYVTNRATRSAEATCVQLRGYGLEAAPEEVLTSAQTAAHHVAGGRVYMIGEEGLAEELLARGCTLTEEGAEWVVVGLDRQATYRKIDTAARLVRAGARFVATNPDKVMNTSTGIAAGNGAVVAAVAAAGGREPEVIGKPARPLFELAVERLGLPAERVLMVGDNLETDIRGGLEAGLQTAFLLTGVAVREDAERLGIRPHYTCADYDELSTVIFS